VGPAALYQPACGGKVRKVHEGKPDRRWVAVARGSVAKSPAVAPDVLVSLITIPREIKYLGEMLCSAFQKVSLSQAAITPSHLEISPANTARP
jgi:hypothetical protein